MNQSLANKLVLCDLDNLLLGPDGNLTQVVRDVLQLFSSRGGRFTVFSQRTPKAVRAILGSVRLSAPALVCGGTLAYHFADGSRQPLCSFAGQDAGLFASLPSAAGVGIALQMQDGSTRVLQIGRASCRERAMRWSSTCSRSGPPICWPTQRISARMRCCEPWCTRTTAASL